jgi:hypothetical protein
MSSNKSNFFIAKFYQLLSSCALVYAGLAVLGALPSARLIPSCE